MRRLTAPVVLAVSLALAPSASGAPTLVEVGRFEKPVAVASPPGDLRLFVVEQAGRIEIVDPGGTILAAPFLDVSGEVVTSYEQGLLNLAFAPDYTTSGRFYVYLTASGGGQVQVREYRRSTSDPNRAEPTARVVLRQDHSQASNHNGGGLAFGPDGKLWASIGDGGGGDNSAVPGSAQSTSTLLGKLVRFDPAAATAPEIVHVGLRNPWRFSFDRETGDLLIGDVGQGAREEIDVALKADGWLPGANWGWPCWEGTLKNPQAKPAPCDPPDDRFPAFELDHSADGVSSITGGVVVRDPGLPTLAGRYLYGDIGLDRLRSLALNGTTASDDRSEPGLPVTNVASIAEDACGRVLVASVDGSVSRVIDGAPSACTATAPPAPPGTAPPPGATPVAARCGLRMTVPRRRSVAIVLRRGIRVGVEVRARCAVRVRGSLASLGALRTRSVTLVAGERRAIRVRPSRAAARALRRRGRRVVARVEVRFQPVGGVARTRRARVVVLP